MKPVDTPVITTEVLPNAGKFLGHLLLNRLLRHLEEHAIIQEKHYRVRVSLGTVDLIFAARQVQKKSQEQNNNLLLTFVDVSKAFNTICRDGLWTTMKTIGCPGRFILIILQFHDGMKTRII